MQDIHQRLLEQPGLAGAIKMDTAMRFVRLAASLKRDIVHVQKPTYDLSLPPPSLPQNIHTFLGSAVNLSDDFVTGCWRAFKTTVWSYDAKGHSSMADSLLFYKYGRNQHLGMYRNSEMSMISGH